MTIINYYQHEQLTFASPSIALYVMKHMQVSAVRQCLQKLHLFNLPLSELLSGDMFKSIATCVLAAGGEFIVRNMSYSTQGRLTFTVPDTAVLPLSSFASLSDLAEQVKSVRVSLPMFHVFQAEYPNECGIDGVIWHNGTFYMYIVTCTETHPLSVRSANGQGGL
jgi:hypothetical protein